MSSLFIQLGLPNAPEAIESFVQEHQGLSPDIPLAQADFWSPSQSAFLREAIENDSDWCEVVDELNSLLRG
jgi:hypothetical protein